MTLLANTRADLDATAAALGEPALLVERGRAGMFVPVLATSLSPDAAADAVADVGQADHIGAGAYIWVRKFGRPRSVQRYGAHPEETPANNYVAIMRALARESYIVFDAEVNSAGVPQPYMVDAQIVSPREGQIIEGEGHVNSVVKASGPITPGAVIKLAGNRFQHIHHLTLHGNGFAQYAAQMDFPKCQIRQTRLCGATLAGVRVSHFSCFVGDGCLIDSNLIGVYVADGTGPTNDFRMGGGALTIVQLNASHGIYAETHGRDGYWLQNINSENNNTSRTARADVFFQGWSKGVHIRDMYHETDFNDPDFHFYRFTSSCQGVSMRDIKMNASAPAGNPNSFICVAYDWGTIGNNYTMDDIWAGGHQVSIINNRLSNSAQNDLRLGSIYNKGPGAVYDVATRIRNV